MRIAHQNHPSPSIKKSSHGRDCGYIALIEEEMAALHKILSAQQAGLPEADLYAGAAKSCVVPPLERIAGRLLARLTQMCSKN